MKELAAAILVVLPDEKLRNFWNHTISAQKPGPAREEFKKIQRVSDEEATTVLELGRELLVKEFDRRELPIPS